MPTCHDAGTDAAARTPDPAVLCRAAFTLIELLVVIAIISLLIAILLPALQRAREQTRLAVCTANLRSQGQAIHSYANEFGGALPPRYYRYVGISSSYGGLINEFLARYIGQPLVRPDSGAWAPPTGVFRCPDLSADRDEERFTHSGYLHYAPNTWLFSSVTVFEASGRTAIDNESLPGWEGRIGLHIWRKSEGVRRQSELVALIDNVNYYTPFHGHRDARESIGRSEEIFFDANHPLGDNRGSHERMRRRPALMLDGHCEPLPSARSYWLDVAGGYRAADTGTETLELYAREVERFMWFVQSGDALVGGSD